MATVKNHLANGKITSRKCKKEDIEEKKSYSIWRIVKQCQHSRELSEDRKTLEEIVETNFSKFNKLRHLRLKGPIKCYQGKDKEKLIPRHMIMKYMILKDNGKF